MRQITLRLTTDDLKLLASLASDQLFRREFIDPKMPGHQRNPGELAHGKALLEILRGAIQANSPRPVGAAAASGFGAARRHA